MSSTSAFYTIIMDVYDSANHALKTVFSMIHTHVSNAQGGTLDHGLALTGLTDDDHTQYQKESLLTTAGDMPYATAASTWARLAVGGAGALLKTNSGAMAPEWLALGTVSQYLRVNAGATAPEWVSAPLVPTGSVTAWAGLLAAIPSGFLHCDGASLLRADYAALFAVIGVTYGEPDGTHFNLPNLLTRFVEGVATAATNPGATGGATNKTTAGHETPSHTLTSDEMPAHAHTIQSAQSHGTSGSYPNNILYNTGSVNVDDGYVTLPNANIVNTGGGGGHVHSSQTDTIADIRPLYMDLAYIIKT